METEQQILLRKKWQKIYEGWKASGLKISRYCKEKQVSEADFFKWRKRLGFPISTKPRIIIYDWEKIDKDLEASGLSARRYCREKKINVQSFYKWRRKTNHPAYKNPERIADKWRKIIKDWENSGLTPHAYGRVNGFSQSLLSKWDKRLNPHKIRERRKMRKRTDEKSLAKWTKIFEEWKKSGLSKFTYCQRNRISSPNFYMWIKKLNFLDPPQSCPDFKSPVPDICLEDYFTSISFGSGILMGSLPTDKKIEITFSQGHKLTIEGQCDWEGLNTWIARLLQPKDGNEKEI